MKPRKIIIYWMLLLSLSPSHLFSKGESAKAGDRVFSRAEQLFSEQKYAEALLSYQELIAKYPLSPLMSRAQFKIGECYYLQGREKEAAQQFHLYISNNRGSREELARSYEYLMAIEKKKFQQADSANQERIRRLEKELARVKEGYRWLKESVEGQDVYLEIDVVNNQLHIKMGVGTLYSFAMVSGKGKEMLKETGEEYDFSTPRGIIEVIGKETNPVWYRPDWFWLERGELLPDQLSLEDRAVPNYLGKYRINLGGGYSIHGTASGAIKPGKYSHGCIRMKASDLEKVWEMVKVGTKVYIY